MKYHQATFDLLGKPPQPDPKAAAAIARAEKRLGRKLPPSLVEWYSFRKAEEILRRHCRCDDPVRLSQFGRPDDSIEEDYAYAFIDKLSIRHENQGCCLWVVHLNGAADPPVCVVEDGHTGVADGLPWVQAHPTYSQYVYTCVWDQMAEERKYLAQAQNGPLSPGALETLQATFTPMPISYGWPYDIQYRFQRGETRIVLWAKKEECCDWVVGANDERSFIDVLREVGDLDDVKSVFYGEHQQAMDLARSG